MANTKITAANIDSTSTGFTLADLTVDTTTLVVDASNNRVGIGTSSPNAKLDVSGVFQFFDDVTPEIKIVDSDDNNYALVGYSDGTMTLSSNHGNEAGGADVMQFLTGGSEKMRIDSSGNVGIGSDSISGISSNATTLDIRGGVTTKGGAIRLRSSDSSVSTYLYADNTNGLSINTSTSHPMVFRTAGAEAMRIDSSGNVGIGTVPQAFNTGYQALEVENLNFMSRQSTDSYITTNSAYLTSGWTTKITGESALYYQAGATHVWSTSPSTSAGATTSWDERMRISSDGKVGIGITPSEGKLHVKSDSSGEVELLTLENSTGTNGKTTLTFKTTSTDSTKSAQIFAERVNASGHTDLAFRTYNGSTSEAVRIDHDGNVGIGTNSPDGLLHISSGTAGDAILILESDTDNDNEADNPQIWLKGDGDITKGAIRVADNQLELISNVNSVSGIKFYVGSTNNTGTTDPGTSATQRMFINENGRVHIGHSTETGWDSLGTLVVQQATNNVGIGIVDAGGNNTLSLVNDNTLAEIKHNLAACVIQIGDGNKAVTMPSQPAFHAYGPGGSISDGSYVVYANTYVNTGSHYSTSNGRFTAPVAGVYLFFWSAIGNNTNDVYRWFMHKNGSATGIGGNDVHLRQDTSATGSEYATNNSRVQMVSLSASDYVQIYFDSDGGTSAYHQSDYVNFGGYLIG